MKKRKGKAAGTFLTLDPLRALSWSSISSFKWNKDQWWRKYVGKELPEITPELEFGSYVDKRIQDDPKFLPMLERYAIQQHKMEAAYNGIPLIGVADQFDPNKKCIRLADDKTGRVPWTKARADDTGQLTMYCLLLWLTRGIRPGEVELWIRWMPTHYENKKIAFIKEGDIRYFKTARTMKQVLEFGQEIIDIYAQMLDYCEHRPVLDTHSYEEFYAA